MEMFAASPMYALSLDLPKGDDYREYDSAMFAQVYPDYTKDIPIDAKSSVFDEVPGSSWECPFMNGPPPIQPFFGPNICNFSPHSYQDGETIAKYACSQMPTGGIFLSPVTAINVSQAMEIILEGTLVLHEVFFF
jgi:hypothetical protein